MPDRRAKASARKAKKRRKLISKRTRPAESDAQPELGDLAFAAATLLADICREGVPVTIDKDTPSDLLISFLLSEGCLELVDHDEKVRERFPSGNVWFVRPTDLGYERARELALL
jgi:hypothetical protein